MDYLMDVLSGIFIPYIYTIRVLLTRKIFHEENFLQGKFFPVTLMYSFRFYNIDYVAVIPTLLASVAGFASVPAATQFVSLPQSVLASYCTVLCRVTTCRNMSLTFPSSS